MITRLYLLKYFIREAAVNINRNKMLNMIAVGIIAVSLAIFGIFLLIYSNLNTVARRWSDAVHIIAYLDDNLSDQQREQLAAQIRAISYVTEVKYTSPDEARKKFTARLAGYEYLLEGLESNPLPASYEIQLEKKYRDLASVRKVVEALQAIPAIDDVQYGQQWLENLTLLVNMLKLIGAFLGTFLFLTVIFIISNTIKLTLYTREDELSIMKFIGATESFIKGPFLTEGILQGLAGAFVALGVLSIMYKLFLTVITHSSTSLLSFSAISFFSWIGVIGLIGLGTFLGWCGSLLTLHKYLKTY